MDEQRLAEIEARLREGCGGHEDNDGNREYCYCFEDFEKDGLALIAEIRRLRDLVGTGS